MQYDKNALMLTNKQQHLCPIKLTNWKLLVAVNSLKKTVRAFLQHCDSVLACLI